MSKPEEKAMIKELSCTPFFRAKCKRILPQQSAKQLALQHDQLFLDLPKPPLSG